VERRKAAFILNLNKMTTERRKDVWKDVYDDDVVELV